ncbi:hypothetical protein I317_00260 [Kwoniella heveanensis CBS 569]|nr:hypothetical protein I317_00260 [Kwoniella heveanensis CBS 569]
MKWSILLSVLPIALGAPAASSNSAGTNATASVAAATTTTTASGSSTNSTGTAGNYTAPTVKIYPNSANGNGVEITGVNFPQFKQDVYLGVPFAAPPVSENRFQPPQDYIYNFSVTAQRPPPTCLQDPTNAILPASEDCLFLNVFVPEGANAQTAYLPVMVWVHGGSFTGGDATTYNGTFLEAAGMITDRPVIYVALQYRLGVFGWGYGSGFAENGAGNLGLRDIKKGLEWVQQNIWAFGGDPSQVTVFGESAGSIAISLLYLDESINTFKGAIMESGAQSTLPLGPTASTWEDAYQYLLNVTNCTTAASPNNSSVNATAVQSNGTGDAWTCLKTLPAEQLLQGQLAVKENILYKAGFIYGPSIDGDLIPDSPFSLLSQGKFAKIPFISGNNKDEGTAFVPTYVNSTQLALALIDLYEPNALGNETLLQLVQLYPNDPSAGSPFGTGNQTFGLSPIYKQVASIFGDATFQATRRHFLSQANQHGISQTWTYQFEQPTPGVPGYRGVFHGSEIPFVFGAARPGIGFPGISTNYTVEDGQLSDAMINYWLNFAYYNNPNGPSDSATGNATYWPTHDISQNKNSLRLKSDNITVFQDDYRQEQTNFFNARPQEFNYRRSLALEDHWR